MNNEDLSKLYRMVFFFLVLGNIWLVMIWLELVLILMYLKTVLP